jgi:hypothetical protein
MRSLQTGHDFCRYAPVCMMGLVIPLRSRKSRVACLHCSIAPEIVDYNITADAYLWIERRKGNHGGLIHVAVQT